MLLEFIALITSLVEGLRSPMMFSLRPLQVNERLPLASTSRKDGSNSLVTLPRKLPLLKVELPVKFPLALK